MLFKIALKKEDVKLTKSSQASNHCAFFRGKKMILTTTAGNRDNPHKLATWDNSLKSINFKKAITIGRKYSIPEKLIEHYSNHMGIFSHSDKGKLEKLSEGKVIIDL
jgi:hypothetical protein